MLLDMAVSVDGFVSGPDGDDGGLYDWYVEPSDASRPVVEALVAETGAIVIGRGVFGRGDDAAGWDETPYAVPHFVVTHRPPRVRPAGPVEFVFVTDGLRSAVDRAREAAGDRYATIGGGADVARQALAAGLVDEVQLHVVAVLLGDGLPLFGRTGAGGWALRTLRIVDAPGVTHHRYRVERPRR